MDEHPIVVFDQIKMSFGDNEVVKGINLEIKEGDFVTLLGPSGCGKTTLLRILAGFLSPSQGKILIRGKDVTALPAYKRNLGMVFQNYALWPHMNVQQHLEFGMKIAKMDKTTMTERVDWALSLVGLQNLKDRVPAQLSGGQQPAS